MLAVIWSLTVISFRRGGCAKWQVWVDIPFTGMLNLMWEDGTRGCRFLDIEHHESGKNWWVGPLKIEYATDRTLRPSTGAFMLFLALVGWTQGHLWNAPEALGE